MRKVSAIIPTLNEEKCLPFIISDLLNQSVPPFEIIVSDSSHNSSTREIARRLGARVVRAKRTIADARNAGAKISKGEILLFVDADVRLPSIFIERSVAEIERRNLDFACPLLHPGNSSPHVKLAYYAFNAVFILFQNFLPSGAGTCFFAKREAFFCTGGFDPAFKFEDAEFIRRTAKTHRFGIIHTVAIVSDRRFRKYGFLKTLFTYLKLSLLFLKGDFKSANRIDYKFGDY